MGSAVTITTTATNSAYRHTLRYTFGGATGTIASGVATSQSWTPSLDLAKQIPSALAGTGTIYCDTYSGSTLLGTKSVSITLNVPSSVKPTAGTLAAAINSDTSGTGKYVKGMCKAKVTLSGSGGAYGSTVKSYTITGGGYTVNTASFTTGILASSGTITFTASVTDSRGRTSNSVTCSITVLDYTKPSVSSCKVYRCDASGNTSNAGTYFAVECTANYSSSISGNALTINAKYKKSTDSTYGTATACTSGTQKVIGGNLSASSTYDVQVIVSDNYNTVTLTYSLPTKSTLLSFIKNTGAAIGKVAELANWLDVQWSTRIRSNFKVDGTSQFTGAIQADGGITGAVKDYVVSEGTSGVWRYRKWNSGVSECWGVQTVSGSFQSSSSQWRGLYTALLTSGIAFPTDLFTEKPSLQITLDVNNFPGFIYHDSGTAVAHTGSIAIACPGTFTVVDPKLHFHAVGKWK